MTKINVNRVNDLQKELKLNSSQMASKLGYTRAQYCAKRAGSQNWTLNDLTTLMELSGKDANYFLESPKKE